MSSLFEYNQDKKNNLLFSKLKKKINLPSKLTDYSKVIVRKPWGYEYLIFQNENVAITILNINKNQETSFHCHPRKKTSLLVLHGEIICKNLNYSKKIKTGQCVLIDKKVFHQSINKSNDNCILMEIETPNMKQDILRFKDKYGRKNMGYELSDKFVLNVNNYNFISLDSPLTYQNITKKFFKSSITFLKIKNKKHFLEIINKFSGAFFSILNGEVKINNTNYFVGNTFLNNIRNIDNKISTISNNLLLLVTKKNDDKIKSSDLIIDTLINQNINKAFFVPGDTNLHLIDSIGRRERFEYETFDNEYNASYAALGYAKTNFKPSVIISSSGHSTTKIIEAVTAAYIDSEPLLVISGQATKNQSSNKKIRQLGNKSLDIIQIVKSITKYSIKIKNEYQIVNQLEKAIYLSKNNRPGPVWIDIPIDLLGKTLNEDRIKHFKFKNIITENTYKLIDNKVRQIFKMLNNCKKPLLLVGYGVRVSKAEKELISLINYLKIPVVTSRRGTDLVPSTNKYFFGRPGVYGNRYSNIILQKCDLLICIGSRLSIPLVGRNSKAFAKNAKKIIVDVDINELDKKTIKPDYKIKISSEIIIKSMLGFRNKLKGFNLWLKDCNYIKKQVSFDKENYTHSKNINPYIFIKDLSKYIPSESIIFMDGSTIMNYTMQSIEIKTKQRLITSSGLDNHGFSLAAAIGLSTHQYRNFIVVFCEEMAIINSLQNLNKIKEKNLPIKIFSFQNVNNIAIKNTQKDFFGNRLIGTDNIYSLDKILDKKIFKSFGINYLKFTKKYNGNMLKKIFSNKKPTLVTIKSDENHKIKPKMGFEINFNGIWYPKSLEDMYPFIDQKLLDKLMKS